MSALYVSMVFLACYLTRVDADGHPPVSGTGIAKLA